jgi:hypothetical protein
MQSVSNNSSNNNNTHAHRTHFCVWKKNVRHSRRPIVSSIAALSITCECAMLRVRVCARVTALLNRDN